MRELVPVGLSGIVMAGLASGMLSHISSVLNSCSTVFTMDLYKPFFGTRQVGATPGAGRAAERVRHSGDGHGAGDLVQQRQLGVFLLIQNVGAWVAAPIAAVFLLGVLWRRTTAAAATFVLVFGFPYTAFVEYVPVQACHVADAVRQLAEPHASWSGSPRWCCWSWFRCSPRPPDPERIRGIIWSWDVAKLPESERERNRGIRNLLLWWSIFIGIMAALYVYVIWFQYGGPGAVVTGRL